jgi:transcription elongation factor GreA
MSGAGETEAITAQGLEELKAEIARLEGAERQAIAERILRAREHGDLSENAEYHAAKEDQAHLETRILRLLSRLRSARVVATPVSTDVVAFGSTVTFVDEASGKEQTFTLVGTTEQDLKTGKLSSESPIGRALVGAKVGDVVAVQTPGGARDMRVTKLG